MSMKITIAALSALLLAGPVLAADAKPAPSPRESMMTFFRHLKDSLAQSAVQGERKRNRVGSVAGADQSSPLADPNEPVLKGDARSRKDKAAMAEDAEFAKAVDLVLTGKSDEGVQALEAFKNKHPKSRNLDKVQQAIDAVKSLTAQKSPDAVPAPASVAAAEPAPAAAAKADAPKADAPAAPSASAAK
jgi:chemotaxis response regulator CheB